MARHDYIYQLVGRIVNKQLKKKKDGNTFAQLAVIIPDQERVKKINVFRDSCNKEEVWETIEGNQYLGKEYLFSCKNYMGSYFLVNWEERNFNHHGSN